MKLITLVVPIYNVELYLQECLDSVANQTIFKKLAVVLVNDGSTDSSGEIAATFAAGHQNVTLINQENHGLGFARNVGLDAAQTPYIGFLDSDDVLPAQAMELLWRSAKKHGSDLAIGVMKSFPLARTHITHRVIRENDGKSVRLINAPEIIHSASACNKLFRTDFIRKAGFRFGEGVHFEDIYFTIPALFAAKGISFVNRDVYLYRRGLSTSIMGNALTRAKNYTEHLVANEFLLNLLGGQLSAKELEVLQSFCIRSIQGYRLILIY
jgi:glycosyltransferase involved in cell wall biosynthesis